MAQREHIKRLCLIPLCRNERFDLVHKFPMDNQRAEEWRRAINIPEINSLPLDMLRKRTICSKHFRKEDYKNVESRSLNKTAVPSLNFRDGQNVEKTITNDEMIKGHSLMVGLADNAYSQEASQMQNKRESDGAAMERDGSGTTSGNNVERKRLFKLVSNAANASTTVLSDTGNLSKRRVVVENRVSNILQCNDEQQLSLLPSRKTMLDAQYVNVTLLPVVDINEDPITLIDQSAQLDFLTTKTARNYIDDDDLYATEMIADPYAENEIVEQLNSAHLSE